MPVQKHMHCHFRKKLVLFQTVEYKVFTTLSMYLLGRNQELRQCRSRLRNTIPSLVHTVLYLILRVGESVAI